MRLFTSRRFQTTADIFLFLSAPLIKRGVDLYNRAKEVESLFYAGFGSQVVREGYEPEDVLQEIYQGILARNKGINPYNPEVSSFGHYVHMVCRSVWFNYREKMKRLASRTGTVRGGNEDGDWGDVDAADAAVEPGYDIEPQIAVRDLMSRVSDSERLVLQAILDGHSPRQAAAMSGINVAKVMIRARALLGDYRG